MSKRAAAAAEALVYERMSQTEPTNPRIAWAIHIFTAVGIIAGFLALTSALDRSPRMALTWMTIAMVIDGLDGPFARKYEISAVLPHIDGHIGDLIIDYVTTVIAPAFFIHEFDLLPKQYNLLGISLMLLTSLVPLLEREHPDRRPLLQRVPGHVEPRHQCAVRPSRAHR